MRYFFLSLVLVLLISACGRDEHNQSDDFARVNEVLKKRAYKKQFDSLINIMSAADALLFKKMYEMMPLEDVLDYTPLFHYKIMESTLKAKTQMQWGDSISQKLFTYFVLPERINNENLDTGRIFFYKELKNRLKGMSMLDAAMEINHYCHEHVSYRASDERTSSPLTTYRNGYGRCGEESVFVVSVLRALSIPARQVYTPRWAHTDDNHAWVEFWASGKWHYFGATEPMAEPDIGWFTEPARRAMLVGTRVNGNYSGDERINYKTGAYTMINTTPVYAPTKEVFVKVLNAEGKTLKGARVDFQIYNYGEFYTLGPKKSDAEGLASFLTGYGDMLVWATDGNNYAYAELDVRTVDTLQLVLNKKYGEEGIFDFDYNPPEKPEPLKVSQAKAEENNKRLQYEDSLRRAYENTFPDSAAVEIFASKYAYDFNGIFPLIRKSRGNWQVIETFLSETDKEKREEAVALLRVLSVKDLHDVTMPVLEDHLLNTPDFDKAKAAYDRETWEKYVLRPRVEYEMLLPYRAYLIKTLKMKGLDAPGKVFEFMRDSLKLDSTNYSRVPISAKSVFTGGLTDEKSRDLVFVEACRSLGFAARLEPGSLIPQFYEAGKWERADFKKKKQEKESLKGFLHLNNPAKADLKYYKHFTIAKFSGGVFYTLAYDWDKPIGDFPEKISLDTGFYRITTGNRQPDGSVLSQLIFFNIKPGKVVNIDVKQRSNALEHKVVAHLNPNAEIFNDNKKACTLTADKPLVALWINPGSEPSKHLVEDINKYAKDFEKSDITILLITDKKPEQLDRRYFGHLPSTAKFRIDGTFSVLKSLSQSAKQDLTNSLPVVAVVESSGDVIFIKTGYTIGIGEELLKIIN